MVICLERSADLHMAQLMPLPLIISCFSKIQIGFTFLVLAHPGSPGQRAVKRVCKAYTQGDSGVISMPAGFCRHVVGKTLINVFTVIVLKYALLAS